MNKTQKLFQELDKLDIKGLTPYGFVDGIDIIQGFQNKENSEIQDIELYIEYYKEARLILKELVRLTKDVNIYDKYIEVNEHIKLLESLHTYKTMGDMFLNMSIVPFYNPKEETV